MTKQTKNSKKRPMTSEEAEAEMALAGSSEYRKYLKEHARKLKELERELSGDNMRNPDQCL